MNMPTPPLPTVLLVDDHAIVRIGVRQLLSGVAEMLEADTLAQARELLASTPVDLLLLDLSLGEEFGLTALPGLRAAHPQLKIIVLTSLAEELYAERALKAGADGFVMKSEVGSTLTAAVAKVLAGEVHLSAQLSSAMLRRVAGHHDEPQKPELSAREVEVLRLVAAGKSTREIAEALNRSVKTIETHKQSLKSKLQADNPAMLMRRALGWFGEGA
jgi:two-component system, NarL family, response regulator FusR